MSYGIYVHIPFCKARCGYCAFCSCTDLQLIPAYFRALYAEVEDAPVEEQISSVYVGGGTPSVVGGQYLAELFARLKAKYVFSPDCEITVECNPESVTAELARTLVECGVNRVSLGLQSVNDVTLSKIGRLHTYADFLRAIDVFRAAGISNLNADLILGLPESSDDFLRSVKTVAELPVTHVSVYALELYKGLPLYDLRDEICTDQDVLADLYDDAMAILSEHGFDRYETSNFAKQGKRCRHNLNYWQEGRYHGFGASASGFVRDVRYTNVADVTAYLRNPLQKQAMEVESLAEQAKEFVMLGLRLDDGISLAEFFGRFECDFFERYGSAQQLLNQGFLCRQGDRLFIPKDKFYIANSILAELL